MEWKEVVLNSRKGKRNVLISVEIEKKYSKVFFDFFGNKFNVFVEHRIVENPKNNECILNLYSLGIMDSNEEKILDGYSCTRDACISMLIKKVGIDKIDEIKEFVNSISFDLDFYFSKQINKL